MKRFILLASVLLLVSFLTTGCGGKGEEKSGETSSEKKIEETEEAENLYLTEQEVKAFIKAYPEFVKIIENIKEDFEPLADKEDLGSGMRLASEFKEKKEEIDAALKDYGFTLESFSATHVKIMTAYAYKQMAGATGEIMKKMLENPNVPEEQKEKIRKNMKEAEESEEMKANKSNLEIVEKYQEELESLFKEK